MVKDTEKEPTKTVFEIQRVYVTEQSCKTPHAPGIFLEAWKPVTHLEMSVKHNAIQETLHEVILQANATVKIEDRTALVVEVQQVGIFKLAGFSKAELAQLLDIRCPGILFPYVRQVIAHLTLETSLPPLVLTPVDFDTVRQQQQQQAQQQKESVDPQLEITEPDHLH